MARRCLFPADLAGNHDVRQTRTRYGLRPFPHSSLAADHFVLFRAQTVRRHIRYYLVRHAYVTLDSKFHFPAQFSAGIYTFGAQPRGSSFSVAGAFPLAFEPGLDARLQFGLCHDSFGEGNDGKGGGGGGGGGLEWGGVIF